MKNMKDGSLMKGMKDGSRRLKDELARSIGALSEGGVDPVLEYRTQRFNRYNDRVEDLSKAMTHYSNTMHAYTQASAQLMHAFSAFFESQMQDAQDADTGNQFPGLKALAQSSLRVEEVHQSLQQNVFDVAKSLQYRTVVQPMQELRTCNAAIRYRLKNLKQKLQEFDSAQRHAEAQKKSSPDFDKAQLKLQSATMSLSTAAENVDADMTMLETRRESTLKNELLAVIATQIFTFSHASEHFQQLVPLLPGVAKPLVLLMAESARHRRQHAQLYDPATADVMGIIRYSGEFSRGILDRPLCSHRDSLAAVAAVHPIGMTSFKQSATRYVRLLSTRSFASHAKPHVHMPETAMLTNNATHRFEHKGWEYSAYMGMLGGPILLFLGLTNVPETDSEVFAREEVLAHRAGKEFLARRPSGPASQRFTFKPREIGEPPVLEEQ